MGAFPKVHLKTEDPAEQDGQCGVRLWGYAHGIG